jgi:hypothetical protein
MLLTQLYPNLLAAAIGALAAWGYSKLRLLVRYRNLAKVLPKDRRIQVVLPSTSVADFKLRGHAVVRQPTSPSNVLWVPIGDGLAMARFLTNLSRLPGRQYVIQEVIDKYYDDRFELTVAFGGQYVNDVSNYILRARLPELNTTFEGKVTIKSLVLDPNINEEGALTEDFGFILVTHDAQKRCVILIWGIHSPGTDIAGKALFSLQSKSDATKLLRRGADVLIVVHVKVEGLRTFDPTVILVVDVTRSRA